MNPIPELAGLKSHVQGMFNWPPAGEADCYKQCTMPNPHSECNDDTSGTDIATLVGVGTVPKKTEVVLGCQ